MECSDCGVRSAVGYCHECETMLCEVCGHTCERCGNLACRSHLQRTSSGRNICVTCVVTHYDKRARQSKERRERRAEETVMGSKTRKRHKHADEGESLSFEALARDLDPAPPMAIPELRIEQMERTPSDFEPRQEAMLPGPLRDRDALNARVLTGSANTRTPTWLSGLAMGGLSWLLCLAIGGNGPDVQKALFNLVALITAAGTVLWTARAAFAREATPERTRSRIALAVGLGALMVSGALYAMRWSG